MHITKPRRASQTPTTQSYSEWADAYDFFNAALFASKLPPCLITLNRRKSAYGYFSPERFESGKRTAAEIAMNPDHLKGRSDHESLSTLVHEMVHLWQQHFGKPSRSGYHNKEWAEKMKEAGLYPSDTGAPGGKETGQRCSHYIVKDGPFDAACGRLIETGFKITWKSSPKPAGLGKSGSRCKYTCPCCDTNVWGKEGLLLSCRACDEKFEVTG